MTFFHVVKVHRIHERPDGWRADLPNRAAESVAGAERSYGKTLTLSCVKAELCFMLTKTETHPGGGSVANISTY